MKQFYNLGPCFWLRTSTEEKTVRQAENSIQDSAGLAGDIVRPNDKRTKGQQRLYQPTATVIVYKNSFFQRTIREWNLLPSNVTDTATLEEFRVGLGTVLPTLQP